MTEDAHEALKALEDLQRHAGYLWLVEQVVTDLGQAHERLVNESQLLFIGREQGRITGGENVLRLVDTEIERLRAVAREQGG